MGSDRAIDRLSLSAGRLVGLELRGSKRALDMEMFRFGPDVAWRDPRGNVRTLARFALHIQCAWRIVASGALVVASSDQAPNALTSSGRNRFAFRSARLALYLQSAERHVTATRVNETGDLIAQFSDGSSLEVFVDRSTADESYRLIDAEGGDLVVTGVGIEVVGAP